MTATRSLPARPRRRAQISVARALGSDTRAGIFEHLRHVAGPCTVRDVAGEFDLHPNVARTHLELLADAGLVNVGRRKHPGGGRPAKVYTANADLPLTVVEPPSAHPGAPLLVRLLLVLLETPVSPSRARPGGRAQLATRAHEVAATEGRRLVTALSRGEQDSATSAAAGSDGGGGGGDLTVAVQRAIAALNAHAPAAAVVASGQDWVDVTGIRGLFELAEQIRPEVAEALERGLLAGALAASGVRVALAEAGMGSDGPLLRVRATTPGGLRAITPTGRLDTRGRPPEHGVVHAMQAIGGLHRGDVLEVLAEGPGSPAFFARWADRAGHELLAVERAVDEDGRPGIRLLIRRGA